MAGWSDATSAISSVIAAIIGVITLLTVYAAAIQILAQNQQYHLGASEVALGPWRKKVVRRIGLLRLRRITTPKLNVRRLVQKRWSPVLKFPSGFTLQASSDVEKQAAQTTWVNFLEALSVSPTETGEFTYTMETQQDLVNGIVPMRWTGGELAAVCSILGFQVKHEKSTGEAQKVPMPLPMIWSGPLGWIYFRASSDGCIAEYKRRMTLDNQFPEEIHDIMKALHKYLEPGNPSPRGIDIRRRLWHAFNGLQLSDKTLYMGGQDRNPKDKRRMAKQKRQYGKHLDDRFTSAELDRLCRATTNLQGREVTRLLFPGYSVPQDDSETAKALGQWEVLDLSPGLLTAVTIGEFAYASGLEVGANACLTLDRVFVPQKERDEKRYPYALGVLCFGVAIAPKIKEAALNFMPDSFFFSPSASLYDDVRNMWNSVRDGLRKLKVIGPNPIDGTERGEEELFPTAVLGLPQASEPALRNQAELKKREILFQSILTFCNACWHNANIGHTVYTIDDMKLFETASRVTKGLVMGPVGSEAAMDLVWAMLYSPGLFIYLVGKFRTQSVEKSLKTSVTVRAGLLDCSGVQGSEKMDGGSDDEEGRFHIPLVEDGSYDGFQFFAAFCHVIVTHFWMKKKWVQAVSEYTVTIPNSVTMC